MTVVFAGLAALVLVAAPTRKGQKPPPSRGEAQAVEPFLEPGDEAPAFSGALHNAAQAGQEYVDLAALVGGDATEPGVKAVLLSFFATWCAPCQKELPLLQALSTEYKERGLRVVSVAIDKDEAAWPKIADAVQKHGITFPVVKDRYNFIARRWLGEKTALPSVFLVGRDGLVKVVKQGYAGDAEKFLRAEVQKVLEHE